MLLAGGNGPIEAAIPTEFIGPVKPTGLDDVSERMASAAAELGAIVPTGGWDLFLKRNMLWFGLLGSMLLILLIIKLVKKFIHKE